MHINYYRYEITKVEHMRLLTH